MFDTNSTFSTDKQHIAGSTDCIFGSKIGEVATELLGPPNVRQCSKGILRWGTHGSLKIDLADGVWHDKEANVGGGTIDLVLRERGGDRASALEWLEAKGFIPPRDEASGASVFYEYADENGEILYKVERRLRSGAKSFLQHGPDGRGGFISRKGCMQNVRRVLYRLPELIAADPAEIVFVCEGEKDADRLVALGLVSTTNPGGANKFPAKLAPLLTGRRVVVLEDNDEAGRTHAADVKAKLASFATDVAVLTLPVPPKGDVSDWLDDGGSAPELCAKAMDALENASARTTHSTTSAQPGNQLGVNLTDFRAYMPNHSYIFMPSGEMWPASSVNSRIPPIPLFDREGQPLLDDKGKQILQPANRWLDQHQPVEQVTWAPGDAQVVQGRLISDGGWIDRKGCNVFNLYRPPLTTLGDPAKAERWIEHIRRVYPDDADHIIDWLAHRIQRPQEKINHAIVMGGAQGIGKDTILEPVKAGIGPWNFAEVSPQHMLGRFNGFLKSVILRVSEARDLGDVDRFGFYDHMKTYTAAPPDVLRVDEKHLREYSVFNVCGVIITTNHKSDGIYLPADDRRHYVAWSEITREEFEAGYWTEFYRWYQAGGTGHVVAYLRTRDLSDFDAKAPPRKTPAFWDIVSSNQAPEEAEMNDALEALGWPDAVTVQMVASRACDEFREFLTERKHSRRIPHRFEECGYVQARNEAANDGLFKVNGKRCVIYARKGLGRREQLLAANAIMYPGGR